MAQRIVVFGGTGFVGTRVVEQLSARGVTTIGVSRSGKLPWHLQKKYGGDVPGTTWAKCDAQHVDPGLLLGADAVVTLIGSPPIPSLTQSLYDHQLLMNGQTNVNVISAAKQAGIRKIVLLAASIPSFLQLDGFGYSQGKKMACEHLEAFVHEGSGREGIVLKPGVIYGTRHTDTLGGIPMTPFVQPFHCLQSALPTNVSTVTAVVAPIPVDRVASIIAHYATTRESVTPGYLELDNETLLKFPL